MRARAPRGPSAGDPRPADPRPDGRRPDDPSPDDPSPDDPSPDGPGADGPGADSPAHVGDYAGRVLDAAESIPPGRVMSYGDIAELLGEGGPRQVGRVMSLWGGGVPWWRVVHADGQFLAGHEREALRHYRREGTPLRRGADGMPSRIDMRRARWPGQVAVPGGSAQHEVR